MVSYQKFGTKLVNDIKIFRLNEEKHSYKVSNDDQEIRDQLQSTNLQFDENSEIMQYTIEIVSCANLNFTKNKDLSNLKND